MKITIKQIILLGIGISALFVWSQIHPFWLKKEWRYRRIQPEEIFNIFPRIESQAKENNITNVYITYEFPDQTIATRSVTFDSSYKTPSKSMILSSSLAVDFFEINLFGTRQVGDSKELWKYTIQPFNSCKNWKKFSP